MQFPGQILQTDWRMVLERALTITGLAIGNATLGRPMWGLAAGARAGLKLGLPGRRQARPLGLNLQWTRLVEILERAFAQMEDVEAAHARAVEAIEATDELFNELMADLLAIGVLPQAAVHLAIEQQPPAPVPQRLAA